MQGRYGPLRMLRVARPSGRGPWRAAVLTATDMAGECNDPIYCAQLAQRWAMMQSRWSLVAEAELSRYRDCRSELELEEHADRRCLWRCISRARLRSLVLYGEVIYCSSGHRAGECGRLLMLFWDEGRPFHAVLVMRETEPWVVKTVYRPSTRPWRWSPDWRRKLCFCPGGED